MGTKERKTDIYRKALLALNMRYDEIMREKEAYDALADKTGKTDPGTPLEKAYCDMFFDSSVTYCASLRPWSFLISHEEYNAGDITGETYKGYGYGYEKPYDMLRPYLVDGDGNADWAVDADSIYFPEPISRLDYVMDGFSNMTGTPALFDNLIASRLAVEIAPYLAPDTQVTQRCAQQFQLTLSSMADTDRHNQRTRIPKPEEYIGW